MKQTRPSMKFVIGLGGLALSLCLFSPRFVFAADECEAESKWQQSAGQRHFMVLAGRNDVFFDKTGPSFVMMIKTSAEEAEIGAIGLYPDTAKQPTFGAVPASTYEAFMSDTGMRETGASSQVMLRLEITGPQYERALGVLATWDRRVRENALLYPEIALDNILMVKQATEELNRCGNTINAYPLTWGLEDEISEHNALRQIPFEYFKTLKQLNPTKHVPDTKMPAALLIAPDVPKNLQTKE